MVLAILAAGLPKSTRDNFMNTRVGDRMEDVPKYLNALIVTDLSADKNFEWTSVTLLRG